jgi:hypothetical protein
VAADSVAIAVTTDSDNDPAIIAGRSARVIDVVEPRPVASRLSVVNCRNDHKLARISVRTRLAAICARYGFSVEPRNGSRVTVAFVMPSGRTYSSVGMVWKDGARAVTARWLKAGAFKRRPGRWRMVPRVNGTPVRSTSFRVY